MMQPNPSSPVYSSASLSIGTFRCPAKHPMWKTENHARDGHLVVFPRVPVRITHVDGRGVVADPNCTMYYNRGQVYTRELLCERGDECEWFAVDPEIILSAAEEFEPAVRDRPDQPFPFMHGPSDSMSYLLQRQLFDLVRSPMVPDAMLIEETFFGVLRSVMSRAYRLLGMNSRRHRSDTQRVHAEAAEAVKAYVAARFQEPLMLHQVAAQVYLSPYHLCRIFHKQTGFTLHQYINHLRLRAALERLTSPHVDLTLLALEVGYSSHSHFTAAFSRAFGAPPAAVRSQRFRAPGRKQSIE